MKPRFGDKSSEACEFRCNTGRKNVVRCFRSRQSGFAFLFLLAIFMLQCKKDETEVKKSILVAGVPVEVEISDSPEERAKGLMFREKLNWNEGMLFIFEKEDTLSFWMQNTSIPLSIAFIDKEGVIIDIQVMRPFDLMVHKSKGSALYALEMNRGWFELNGIEIGAKVFIRLN